MINALVNFCRFVGFCVSRLVLNFCSRLQAKSRKEGNTNSFPQFAYFLRLRSPFDDHGTERQ